MGEEAFYTHGVQEYRKNSRFPTLSRYRDLIGFLKNVFRDGVVTDEELRVVSVVERDILLEYELAAVICSSIPASSPRKKAAERLLSHIYRCFIVMSFAKERAKIQNANQRRKAPKQESVRSKDTDRVLSVKASFLQRELLKDLSTEMQRIEAELPRIRKDLAKLPADERVLYEGRVNAALDYLEQINLENLNALEVNRLLGLERRLLEEKERVKE
ncbi:MAG: hypothetical protein IJY92_03445 [Alphaproteobacteria bacterium]|nr:hypothetical protein [Alphaproteobacteria bacterium]